MTFQPPLATPVFSSNRDHEDSHWRQSRTVGDGRVPSPGQSKITSGYAYPRSQTNSLPSQSEYDSAYTPQNISSKIKDTIGDFLGSASSKDLPMYKDKPHHPAGRRNNYLVAAFPPGRRRRWGLLGVILLFILWWSGLFSKTSPAHTSDGEVVPAKKGWIEWFMAEEIDWRIRRAFVRQAFEASWDDYAANGWGTDIYSPISQKGRMMVTPDGQDEPGTAGIGWIIADGLDTAMMMNLTSRVAQAREWIKTSLDFSQLNGETNTFETTIRVLGGLLSAHYLSTAFPNLAAQADDDRGAKGEDLYIEKAVDLADRLLGSFDTKTGIPFASINLNTSLGIPSIDVNGASSTAEAATLQLELKYVSKLTGEAFYWQKAEEVIRLIEKNKMEGGLLPIYLSPYTGKFQGQNIRLGSRGDSYYEYLIKQFLQTGKREIIYSELWEEALEGVKKHLITFSRHGNFTVLGERQSGLKGDLSGKMDHLVCFMPGTIALAVTGGETVAQAKKRMGSKWGRKQEEDLVLAEELMKTCYGMYAVTPSGLAPEITYMVIDDKPRKWVSSDEDPHWTQPRSTVTFTNDDHKSHPLLSWKKDYDIHANDVHNLQRPETLESLFYMYRITRDEKYRLWGWEIFQAFQQHTQVYDTNGKIRAYSSIDDVMSVEDRSKAAGGGFLHLTSNHLFGSRRDNMEGFWLSETLKYLYLLFSDDEMIQDEWFDISKVVINTEGHFFPRFDIEGSKVFKTGWSRHDGSSHDVPDSKDTVKKGGTEPEIHDHAQNVAV